MKIIDNYLNEIQEPVSEVPIVVPVVGTAIVLKAVKAARNQYKKIASNMAIAKQCAGKTGYSKKLCKSNAKIRAWTKYKNELRRWKRECAKAKDDKKCQKHIDKIFAKVDQAIAKEKAKLVKAATKT